ncbi:MAG: hypothetical protein AABX32_06935 [Nanoarchaeota archaeon]
MQDPVQNKGKVPNPNSPAFLDDVVEFMGVKLHLSKIQNPHLRRIIERARRDGFRHRYDDHSRKEWKEYSEHARTKYHETHNQYSKYSDYHRTGYDDYTDFITNY